MTKDEAIKVLKMVEAHGLAEVAKVIAIEALETEAIPVEFIKQEIKTNKGFYNSSLRRLLDEWAEKKKDIRICGICKHFLGGGDFGTCCDQTYDLKYTDSKVCEKYSERKEE